MYDLWPHGQAQSDLKRETQDPLPHGLYGQDTVHEMGRRLTHPPSPATGAKPTALATERHQMFEVT